MSNIKEGSPENHTVAALRRDIRDLVQRRAALRVKSSGRHRFQNASRRLDEETFGSHSERLASQDAAFTSGIAKRPRTEAFAPEFTVEERPHMELDDSTAQRSKRFFGNGLLGHLQRAKKALDGETEDKNAKIHREKEAAVERKLAQSRKNIQELEKRQTRERLDDEARQFEQVEQALAEKENELMRILLTKHYECMRHFIGTQAQPTVFWMPKIPNETTARLQEKTHRLINEKIQKVQRTGYCVYTKPSRPDPTPEAPHTSAAA